MRGFSFVSLQLPLAPMRLFAIRGSMPPQHRVGPAAQSAAKALACPLQLPDPGACPLRRLCQSGHWSPKMEHQPRLESAGQIATTEDGRIVAVIADLSRTVNMLDRHVAAEEERSRIYDLSNAEYPMLARTITARIENLRATIAALEVRLASTRSVALTEVTKANSSELRRLRRNASPRRFKAWHRLRLSLESGI